MNQPVPTIPCPYCDGAGHYEDIHRDCPWCHGTGKVSEPTKCECGHLLHDKTCMEYLKQLSWTHCWCPGKRVRGIIESVEPRSAESSDAINPSDNKSK